jgi:hypothetical protein
MEQQSFEDYVFWIPDNTPSSKNSKQWTGDFLVNSEIVQRWKRHTKYFFLSQAIWFQYMLSTLPKPHYIEFTFVRKSKRRFDYVNIAQAILDEMVGYGNVTKREKLENSPKCQIYFGWLVDDDTTNVKPYFGEPIYDKENPGVIIKILKEEPIHDLQTNTPIDYRVLHERLNQSIINSRNIKQRNTKFSGKTGSTKSRGRRTDSREGPSTFSGW